ncbi:MAG: HigA family addiction module antitoxin [Alphaproteobacteria bacterium]|nr:HigA family addiction module antitoxin [Alphaproteobacteria bacterium]
MSASANQYNPDYATSPGWILGEHLEVLDISQAELARRCGLSPKLISEIISGKARVTPKTAIQFEKELGLAAEIWLNLESNYQLHLLRKAGRTKRRAVAGGRRSASRHHARSKVSAG